MHSICLLTSRNEREHAVEPALGRRVVERQAAVDVGHVHVGAGGDQQVQTLGAPANKQHSFGLNVLP